MMKHEALLTKLGGIHVPKDLVKLDYDKYDVLGIASGLVETFDHKEARVAMKIARNMNIDEEIVTGVEDATFKRLEGSVIQDITTDVWKYRQEYSLYNPIKFYIRELVPGAETCDHAIVERKVPDIFLMVDGEFCVGEVKPNGFDDGHVRQLKMYMRVYGCERGYAFGQKLVGQLEEGMVFVDVTGVKDKYYKGENSVCSRQLFGDQE
jgi:hypothetical protein